MSDRCLKKLEQLRANGEFRTFLFAYMRDVTHTMHHDIQSFTPDAQVFGRAYTVKGPDLYFNALESIPSNSVYVHGHAGNEHTVWGGGLAEMYGTERGLIAAVIDGGVRGRRKTAECDMPTFARFVSPKPAIDRREGLIQVPVVCGGATVCPGDIILGDADGVVVIPRGNEEEIADKLDGYLGGLALFGKIARTPGVVVTKHEALAEMLELKFDHPEDYWRYYEPWAAKWKDKYGRE